MNPEIPIQNESPAPMRLALSRLFLTPKAPIHTGAAESFLPAKSRQDAIEARWVARFMSVWTFAAIGLWWLHGAAQMRAWQLLLRLIAWPIVWFLFVQGTVIACIALIVVPLLRTSLANEHEKIKSLMQVACLVVLSLLAAWIMKNGGSLGTGLGIVWWTVLGAEMLAGFAPPSALQ
ncbi:MAG: hypothetical protein KDK97_03155 [Verrucomicrobiales bacterium]|nr:hypothetical protein [Verrucomicrobiales bacterium]MCP5560596.1 hypothetical protein [Verrucomicrobiaceae bacterium]